jgi:hypothetical protein
VSFASGEIKAHVAFLFPGVAEEDAAGRAWHELVGAVEATFGKQRHPKVRRWS